VLPRVLIHTAVSVVGRTIGFEGDVTRLRYEVAEPS
jgi:ribosomal protein S28E/S33